MNHYNISYKPILISRWRRCGYDNDRWQMAIIEGTSLGSTALALAGAPLRISVTHPNGEVFVIDPQGMFIKYVY